LGVADLYAHPENILLSRYIVQNLNTVPVGSQAMAGICVSCGNSHTQSTVPNGRHRRSVVSPPVGGVVEIQLIIGKAAVPFSVFFCIGKIKIQTILL
jgi:hypothetical protein